MDGRDKLLNRDETTQRNIERGPLSVCFEDLRILNYTYKHNYGFNFSLDLFIQAPFASQCFIMLFVIEGQNRNSYILKKSRRLR